MDADVIAESAARFGPTPRRISPWDRFTYLWMPRPEWLYQNPNDPLETFFLNIRPLRRDGRVVWGHLVQANNHLLAPGREDNPAEVVYALDAPIAPEALAEVAARLAALKHTKPDDPEAAAIADHLTDEYTRVFGLPVPAAIAPGPACRVSTIYVFRKHLPGPDPFLRAPLLPLVVAPTAPHVAMILPSRYWPEPFVAWWRGES